MISTNATDYEHFDFPHFAKPTEVGCFSLDRNGRVHCDRSQLKFYRSPNQADNLNWNLNEGLDTFVDKDKDRDYRDVNSRNYINDILNWICELSGDHNKHSSLKTVLFDADFVCFRGCLSKLASTPYETREGWKFGVCRYNDVVFICEFLTDERIAEIEKRTEWQKRMTYWGWKFEQYLVVDSPEQKQPNTSVPVVNQEQFASCVRSKLGTHRLLFSGEVDCINDEEGKYLELKTNRIFTNEKQERNFHRFKSYKWWLQSFLIGIENIICGFRDDQGVVSNIRKLSLTQIYKNSEKFWKPSVCLSFLRTILDNLKEILIENDHSKIYLIQWKPGQKYVNIELLPQPIAKQYTFIPEWFINSEK